MIIITSKVTLKPEYREQALKLADSHIQESLKEEGCISHQYYIDKNDPNTVFFFEEWEGQRAVDLHFKTEHAKTLIQNFPKWVAGEIVIKLHEVENVKSLPVGRS